MAYGERLNRVEELVEDWVDELTWDDDSAHPHHEKLSTVCELVVVVDCGRMSI